MSGRNVMTRPQVYTSGISDQISGREALEQAAHGPRGGTAAPRDRFIRPLRRSTSERSAREPSRVATRTMPNRVSICIFFLTFISNNLIYESHCDFHKSQNSMLGRINR